MSKSKGTIYYTNTLIDKGYSPEDIRFFLIYGHYRERLSYSDRAMEKTAELLRNAGGVVKKLRARAGATPPEESAASKTILREFGRHMDNDLDVKNAFDAASEILHSIDITLMTKKEAAGITAALKKIDSVLQVLF